MNPETKLKGLLSPLLAWIRLRKVIRHIPPGSEILDVGCDDGYLAYKIEGYATYTGIDNNQAIIESNQVQCRRKNAHFICGNIEDLKVSGRAYNVFVLAAIIEHIEGFEQFAKVLSELGNPGALMIVTTPVKNADLILKIGSYFRLFAKESNEEHVRYYSRKDFVGLSDWDLIEYEKFELGFNQIAVLKRRDG